MSDEIFESDVIVFLGTPTNQDDRDKLVESVEESGGTVARTVNKKTTIVICDDISVDVSKATTLNIPVAISEYIKQSINQSKRLEPKNYLLSDQKKRKTTDDGDNDDGDDDNDGSGSQTLKKKKKMDYINNFLIKGNKWCGTCTSDDETYPFFWNLIERVGDDISGEIEWPTLDCARSKFRGKINVSAETVEWEEYEAICEADQIEIPQTYSAKFIYNPSSNKPGYLEGKTTTDPSSPSTFKIILTKKSMSTVVNIPQNITTTTTSTTTTVTTPPPPPVPLSFLKVDAEFEGKLIQEFPLVLKVTSRKNEKTIEGTIDWSQLSTKTKIKGTIDGDKIKFTEYEIVSGDGVQLPVDYTGTIKSTSGKGDDSLEGDYEIGVGGIGKFNLIKQQ